MSLKRLIAYSCSSDDDTITHIKDVMVAAGWTLHDDNLAGDSYVLYSNGESGNEMRAYVDIQHNAYANYVGVFLWQQWNSTTHAGSCAICIGTDHRIPMTDSGGHYLWVWATKDSVFVVIKNGATYAGSGVILQKVLYPSATLPIGELQSGVSAGSDVVCQLASGEAANFNTTDTYRIVGSASGEGRYNVTLSAVNTGTDQITIASLTGAKSAGSRIGLYPYKWATFSSTGKVGTDTRNITGTDYLTYTGTTLKIFSSGSYVNPDGYTGKYTMWPELICDHGYEELNTFTGDYIKTGLITNSTYESTVSVGDISTGTSTGSNGASTLNDTGASWSSNAYAGKAVIITTGTGSGQIRGISSNTSTQITVDEAWATTPDATSVYIICNQGWRYFGFGDDTHGRYIREA